MFDKVTQLFIAAQILRVSARELGTMYVETREFPEARPLLADICSSTAMAILEQLCPDVTDEEHNQILEEQLPQAVRPM